jgi:CubicO group peptidase (beta-lactamase class C family)
MDPTIMAWRQSRGEQPQTLNGTVIDAQSVPLKFEPGEGWTYGGGIDWAGLLVSRLNNCMSLEEYMQENIFKPLGLKSTSFRLEKNPELKGRLVGMTERQPDGLLMPSKSWWIDNATEDCAGAGPHPTVGDFIKIVGDLVKELPVLLKKETVEQMFIGQLPHGSNALRDLWETSDITLAMTGMSELRGGVNFALGGMYVEEQMGSMKKGTLTWGGLPNLYWFANRKEGVAGFYASQLLPPGDAVSGKLARDFFQEVFRLSSA